LYYRKTLGLKFLTNKWVLNIVSLLALLSIISYLMTKNYMRAFYFVLLSLLIFNFSKNMILVLGVPLVLINLFVSIGMVKEGLENNTTAASEKPEEPTKTPQQKTEQPVEQTPMVPQMPVSPATPGVPADQQIQENTPGMEDNSGSMPKKRALALIAVIALVGIAFLITRLLR
jgi:outer membrane biosynthesis protein TonB